MLPKRAPVTGPAKPRGMPRETGYGPKERSARSVPCEEEPQSVSLQRPMQRSDPEANVAGRRASCGPRAAGGAAASRVLVGAQELEAVLTHRPDPITHPIELGIPSDRFKRGHGGIDRHHSGRQAGEGSFGR